MVVRGSSGVRGRGDAGDCLRRPEVRESVVAARADGMGPSDISEHLWQLRDLAKQCDSVLECGVRGGVVVGDLPASSREGRTPRGPQRQNSSAAVAAKEGGEVREAKDREREREKRREKRRERAEAH